MFPHSLSPSRYHVAVFQWEKAMSPQVVHFLRIIFGPGRSSVPDPIFDDKGNLYRYPDPDDYAPQFFAADSNWNTEIAAGSP